MSTVSKTYDYYYRVNTYSGGSATVGTAVTNSFVVVETDGVVSKNDVVTIGGQSYNFIGHTANGDLLLENTNLGGGYFILSNEPDLAGPIDITEPGGTYTFCFLAGTQIATPQGNVPIEQLAIGDLVVTRFGGFRAIKWVSVQRMDGRFLDEKNSPVRIKAGALGKNQPFNDLIVSPSHSICMDDVLVSAAVLVNDISIFHEKMMQEFAYYHIDFGDHDVVLAEGAWAESYLESSNRQLAHNYSEYLTLNPDFTPRTYDACLPMITSLTDARLIAIRDKIAAKVDPAAFTTDADFHLLVDEVRIDFAQTAPESFMFPIPAGAQTIRIMSRFVRPCTLDSTSRDVRRLGLCIKQMQWETASDAVCLPIDDVAFSRGWADLEGDDANLWRWTTGDAVIPAKFLPSAEFELHILASLLKTYVRGPHDDMAPGRIDMAAA